MDSSSSASSETGIIGFLKKVFNGIVSVLFFLSLIALVIATIVLIGINNSSYYARMSTWVIILAAVVVFLLIIMSFGLIAQVIAIERNTADATGYTGDIDKRITHLERIEQDANERLAHIETLLSELANKIAPAKEGE